MDANIDIHALWGHTADQLHAQYSPQEAKQIAGWVLEDVYNITPLYPRQYVSTTPAQHKRLKYRLTRLQAGEPVQYVLGYTLFLGKKYRLTQQVLIPRPETEWLVTLAQAALQGCLRQGVLDIGTGSGCIAISMALGTAANVHAIDKKVQILRCARRNAKILGAKVRFMQRDILQQPLPKKYAYDMVISNPPYVLQSEKQQLPKQVRDWEPALALFVPDRDPLLFYTAIATQSKAVLKPNGWLFLETHHLYGKAVQKLLRSMGYAQVRVHQDLSGKDRLVVGRVL